MNRVYALIGSDTYEGGGALMAFETKQQAAEVLARVLEHQKLKPQIPEDGFPDTPKGLKACDDWHRADARWQNKHPAGKHNANFDNYQVGWLPMQRKAP